MHVLYIHREITEVENDVSYSNDWNNRFRNRDWNVPKMAQVYVDSSPFNEISIIDLKKADIISSTNEN